MILRVVEDVQLVGHDVAARIDHAEESVVVFELPGRAHQSQEISGEIRERPDFLAELIQNGLEPVEGLLRDLQGFRQHGQDLVARRRPTAAH